MPAVAIAVGIVVWAPDEIARQYKFEKLRYDYGEWFFFAFWMAIALFVSACAAQLLRLVWDKIVDGYTALRRRSAIRRALADLIPIVRTHDTVAHRRRVIDATVAGVAMRSIQALQQASTMAS